MKPLLHAVHPVLMSSDVETSLRFFERLGFRERFRDRPAEPRYACVSRDGVELHLQWHERKPRDPSADLPVYRFLVSDVDALFAEFRAEFRAELRDGGALPDPARPESPWSTPGDTPWGTREFHLRDPDGNGLQFYESATNRPE